MRIRHLVALAAALFSVPAVAAQTQPAPLAGTITHVSGPATLVRDLQEIAVGEGIVLFDGDRLETDRGRLEISLPATGRLYLDRDTAADLLSGALIRLRRGRLRLVVSGEGNGPARADTPAARLRFGQDGDYRVSVSDDAVTRLSVLHGVAQVSTEREDIRVGAGERVEAVAGAPVTAPVPFNTAAIDVAGFAAWIETRRAIAADRYASRLIATRLRSAAGLASSRSATPKTKRRTHRVSAGPTRWAPTWPYWIVGSGIACCVEQPEPEPVVDNRTLIQVIVSPAEPAPEPPVEAPPAFNPASGLPVPDAMVRPPSRRTLGAAGAGLGRPTPMPSPRSRGSGLTLTSATGRESSAPAVGTSRGPERLPGGSAATVTVSSSARVPSARLPARSTRTTRIAGRSERRSGVADSLVRPGTRQSRAARRRPE